MQELVRLVDGRRSARLTGREGEIFSVTTRARYQTKILLDGDEEWFYSHRFEAVEPADQIKNIGTQPLYTGDPANPTEVKPEASDLAAEMCSASMFDKPPAAPAQAMRFNSGKPQLSYLLAFRGHTKYVFDDCFSGGAMWLAEWYNLPKDKDGIACLRNAINEILAELPAFSAETMCEVSMFGAAKYARGNFLNGRPWSDTVDSLLRHMIAYKNGETNDGGPGMDPWHVRAARGEPLAGMAYSGLPHSGHIRWNLAYLEHCVLTLPHFDDRLRAPE